MPVWILYLLTTIATFFLMEGVAWFSHKYIMHGFLWSLHHDHHQRDDAGFFEKNDAFFVIFALFFVVSIILIKYLFLLYTNRSWALSFQF